MSEVSAALHELSVLAFVCVSLCAYVCMRSIVHRVLRVCEHTLREVRVCECVAVERATDIRIDYVSSLFPF